MKRPSIEPLTGIRAFAALWVVLHHLRGYVDVFLPYEMVRALLHHGYLGVDLFAILSGFVITYTYAERLASPDLRQAGRYLWLRLARVVPLHWFTLALLVVGRAANDEFGVRDALYGRPELILNVLMVHGWGFAERLSWNVPSWTVSAELFCYLWVPLVLPVVVRVRRGGACAIAAGLALGATVVLLRSLGFPQLEAGISWGVLRIGGEMLVGCFLARAHVLGWGRKLPWAAISPAAFAGALGFAAAGSAPGCVLCFAVLIQAIAHERRTLGRLFGHPLLVFWGDVSYSIYLMHWVVLMYLAAAGNPAGVAGAPLGTALWTGVYLAVILASSVASYYAVERPTRRVLRGWIRA